jgi:SAM-dependent methyltransferase
MSSSRRSDALALDPSPSAYGGGLHQRAEHARRYESVFADPRRVSGLLWKVEQDILEDVLDGLRPRPLRALDFACGTGRVARWLTDRVGNVTGVDVSAAMLERAAVNAPRATLVLGDVTRHPDLVTGPFDLVTMFRFLLNAEPELRGTALEWVSRNLGEGGSLIVNIHRNAHSANGLIARARGKLKRTSSVRTLSVGAVAALLEEHGLRVLATYGYGYLPYGLAGSRTVPFSRFVLALESRLAGRRFLTPVASHVIMVARRSGES